MLSPGCRAGQGKPATPERADLRPGGEVVNGAAVRSRPKPASNWGSGASPGGYEQDFPTQLSMPCRRVCVFEPDDRVRAELNCSGLSTIRESGLTSGRVRVPHRDGALGEGITR